jgi:hypothetical protein
MLPKHLFPYSFPTGSNYICNPPVSNTDIDAMFLVADLTQIHPILLELGWTVCGITEYALGGIWSAYRKGTDNAILTDDLNHYMNMFKATEIAKERNLLNKADRITLFHSICGPMHGR